MLTQWKFRSTRTNSRSFLFGAVRLQQMVSTAFLSSAAPWSSAAKTAWSRRILPSKAKVKERHLLVIASVHFLFRWRNEASELKVKAGLLSAIKNLWTWTPFQVYRTIWSTNNEACLQPEKHLILFRCFESNRKVTSYDQIVPIKNGSNLQLTSIKQILFLTHALPSLDRLNQETLKNLGNQLKIMLVFCPWHCLFVCLSVCASACMFLLGS